MRIHFTTLPIAGIDEKENAIRISVTEKRVGIGKWKIVCVKDDMEDSNEFQEI